MNTRKKMKFPAIILGAGKGSRMGNVEKQFSLFHGKPLIAYSVEVFLRMPECGHIVIVVPRDKVSYVKKLFLGFSSPLRIIEVVSGGAHRRESAHLGLQRVTNRKWKGWSNHVVIHDAARPMIKVKDGFIQEAVNKKDFFYGFTPQCLPLKKILEAHNLAESAGLQHDMDNIEVLGLLKKGIKIRILDEFYPNIKLTSPGDKPYLRFLLDKKS